MVLFIIKVMIKINSGHSWIEPMLTVWGRAEFVWTWTSNFPQFSQGKRLLISLGQHREAHCWGSALGRANGTFTSPVKTKSTALKLKLFSRDWIFFQLHHSKARETPWSNIWKYSKLPKISLWVVFLSCWREANEQQTWGFEFGDRNALHSSKKKTQPRPMDWNHYDSSLPFYFPFSCQDPCLIASSLAKEC